MPAATTDKMTCAGMRGEAAVGFDGAVLFSIRLFVDKDRSSIHLDSCFIHFIQKKSRLTDAGTRIRIFLFSVLPDWLNC